MQEKKRGLRRALVACLVGACAVSGCALDGDLDEEALETEEVAQTEDDLSSWVREWSYGATTSVACKHAYGTTRASGRAGAGYINTALGAHPYFTERSGLAPKQIRASIRCRKPTGAVYERGAAFGDHNRTKMVFCDWGDDVVSSWCQIRIAKK